MRREENDILFNYVINSFLESLSSKKPIVDEKATVDFIDLNSKNDIEDLLDVIEVKSDKKQDEELSKILIQELIKDIYKARYPKRDIDIAETILSPTPIRKVYYESPMLIICTNDLCTIEQLSEIIDIDEQYILDMTRDIPIGDKIFIINLDEVYSDNQSSHELYEVNDLIKILKSLGEGIIDDDEAESYLNHLICLGLENNTDLLKNEVILQINVEEKVVAIGLNIYIKNSKKIIGDALGINKKLFTFVCGPFSTVLLIDTRRWFLESLLGEMEDDNIWSH